MSAAKRGLTYAPNVYCVVEFHGRGSRAEDRYLGREGLFLEGRHPMQAVAKFLTRAEAQAAADAATNRRGGGLVSTLDVVGGDTGL